MPCCAGLVRFSKYSLFYTDCHPNCARGEATNMGEEIMSIECRHSPTWLPALQTVAKLVLADVQLRRIDWLCFLEAETMH